MPIYMKYGEIQGSATGKHKGWIELESAQFGTHRNVKDPTGSNVNREASVPAVSEIVVTKIQDVASADLFKQALDGRGAKVVIDFVSPDSKNGVPYLSIAMEGVLISSYNVSGHGGPGSDRPMESLSLNFVKITYTPTPLEHSKDPKVHKDRIMWDLATGQETSF